MGIAMGLGAVQAGARMGMLIMGEVGERQALCMVIVVVRAQGLEMGMHRRRGRNELHLWMIGGGDCLRR